MKNLTAVDKKELIEMVRLAEKGKGKWERKIPERLP